jgi:hypothetical protein
MNITAGRSIVTLPPQVDHQRQSGVAGMRPTRAATMLTMARPEELAERALELARAFVDETDGQLAALSHGDTAALIQAADVVRSTRPDQPESARSAEHIAFTMLHRAFSEAATQAHQGNDTPP